MREGFSKDNLSKWLEFDPLPFIATIVNEIRQEVISIQFRTELIHKDVNSAGVELAQLQSLEVDEKTLQDLTQVMLTKLNNIEDILNTALSYSQSKEPPSL